MMGLFVLGILIFWLLFAIWAAGKLSHYFWRNTASQPIATVGRWLTTLIFTVLVILLPFWDQLIAYPQWQQLCATTGDFEWGPGMDEKKAFGREVVVVNERVTTTTIFPNIKVDFTGQYVYDAKTQELILKKPHYYYSAEGMFYIPSASGNKAALFLPSCSNHSFVYYRTIYVGAKPNDLSAKLNLTVIEEKEVLK